MRTKKHTLTVTLLVLGMTLLVVLQLFWILSNYQTAFNELRRDTDLLFRTSIMSVRTTSWMRSVQRLSGDSSLSGIKVLYYDTIGSSPTRRDHDTVRKNIEVVIHNDRRVGAPLKRHYPIDESSIEPADLVLRLRDDTVNVDTLRRVFAKALSDARVDVSFIIGHKYRADGPRSERIKRGQRVNDFIIENHESADLSAGDEGGSLTKVTTADTIHSSPFRTSPFHEYKASVYNHEGILVRQIAPQILFSIFVTVMIGSAFYLMYRTVRSQEMLMQSKNDFIGNISHELKTPVATVSVVLEALKNFHAIDNPKLTQEYLDIAQAELTRLSIMTDSILETAISEEKKSAYVTEPVNISDVVAQVLRSMKVVFEKKRAQVGFITRGDNFLIHGNPTHLTHVVYNLLDNALKYCHGDPHISIQLQSNESGVVLSVRDNGIGIAPAYHKKIFEKFFRVPTGDQHDVKGYGLGLNYVAAVVSRHQGDIRLESEPGKGSFFIISLPKDLA